MWHRIRSHHRYVFSFAQALLQSFARPIFVSLVFVSAFVMGLNAALFWWLEHGVNPALREFTDALYFSVATMTTVGFGDVAPVTRAGKLLTVGTMLVGSLLFVTYSALLASSIIDIELRSKGTKPESPSRGGHGRA